MTWEERDHPRDGDGQFTWAHRVSSRLPGGSIFDTLGEPNWGASDQQQDQAEQWGRAGLEYADRQTGTRSVISSVEHSGDGFSLNGRFVEGTRTIGTWSIGVLKNDDGHPVISVEEINIDDQFKGQGIAGRWVQKLEQHARDSGAQAINMWDMSSGFWEHIGYRRDRFGMGEKIL